MNQSFGFESFNWSFIWNVLNVIAMLLPLSITVFHLFWLICMSDEQCKLCKSRDNTYKLPGQLEWFLQMYNRFLQTNGSTHIVYQIYISHIFVTCILKRKPGRLHEHKLKSNRLTPLLSRTNKYMCCFPPPLSNCGPWISMMITLAMW